MQDAIAAVPPGAASLSGPSGSGDMETDVHEMRSALFSLGVKASRVDVGELFSLGRLQERSCAQWSASLRVGRST